MTRQRLCPIALFVVLDVACQREQMRIVLTLIFLINFVVTILVLIFMMMLLLMVVICFREGGL